MRNLNACLLGALLLVSFSVFAQDARSVAPEAVQVSTDNLTRNTAPDDFPFLSADQSRGVIPRRVVRPLADKNTCLVNHACYCDGYLDWNQKCWSSESCRTNAQTQGRYCQYWCDDWTKCSTLTESECNAGHC
jgi:hypothetical protein